MLMGMWGTNLQIMQIILLAIVPMGYVASFGVEAVNRGLFKVRE